MVKYKQDFGFGGYNHDLTRGIKIFPDHDQEELKPLRFERSSSPLRSDRENRNALHENMTD